MSISIHRHRINAPFFVDELLDFFSNSDNSVVGPDATVLCYRSVVNFMLLFCKKIKDLNEVGLSECHSRFGLLIF